MKNEGVKTDHMFIHKDKATAINFIIVDREGTKRIIQDPKLRTNIPEPSYFDNKKIEELMNKVAHVHLSATRLETALTVAKKAREKGLTVSLDLKSHAIVSYGKEQVIEFLRNVDLLLPNKLSLKFLFGEVTPKEGARKLLELGPKTVVITLGERGCLVAYIDRTVVIPAFMIKPVDTTGAGDAFNATFTLFHIIEE
jgi:sugar/nucleoside kinase (ribokinase family)